MYSCEGVVGTPQKPPQPSSSTPIDHGDGSRVQGSATGLRPNRLRLTLPPGGGVVNWHLGSGMSRLTGL